MLLFLSALVVSTILTLILFGPTMRMLSGANCTKPNWRKHYVVSSFGILLPIVLISSGAVFSLQFVARTGARFGPEGFTLLLSLITATAFVGFIDDVIGNRVIGGLRGHFSQMRFGIMTTGTLKAVIGLSISIIVAAAVSGTALLFLLNAAVITLSMNAVNLFDLRPGRAIKVFSIAAAGTFAASFGAGFWSLWGFIIPPVLGLLWGDLKERSMIGDAGANALGAILGFSFVLNLSWITNLVILGVLVALHVVSERFSISAFVERTPVLRQLDELGWKR